MKCIRLLLKLTWMFILFGSLTTACRKDPDTPVDGPRDEIPGQNIKSDTASNRRLSNATKKPGEIPLGPVSGSLKISFKNALHLTDDSNKPIKFLPADVTKKSSGV